MTNENMFMNQIVISVLTCFRRDWSISFLRALCNVHNFPSTIDTVLHSISCNDTSEILYCRSNQLLWRSRRKKLVNLSTSRCRFDDRGTTTRSGLSVETSLCTVAPSGFPTDTPSLFFYVGGGGCTHGLSWTVNPYLNYPSKLSDKVSRIVHSKLKPSHFQIQTYYLSDANYQTE